MQSVIQNGTANPNLIRPLGDVHRLAVVGQQAIAAPVVCLFVVVGPAAVIRRVATAVINAVKRVTYRSAAHRFSKSAERARPFITDRNPASAVVAELRPLWVSAAPDHALPGSVFTPPIRATVFVASATRGLPTLLKLKAAARAGFAALDLGGVHHLFVAAFAAPKPAGSTSFVWASVLNRCQLMKNLPGKVFVSRHVGPLLTMASDQFTVYHERVI